MGQTISPSPVAAQAAPDASLSNRRDWKYFDERLRELRVHDVENIIARGRLLIEADDELERGEVEVDGKTVDRKPSLVEQLKAAKTKIEKLKTKLKSAGGSLFDLALDSAEDIGKILADNMSEGRFDVAVRAAKAQYKAKRQKPAG